MTEIETLIHYDNFYYNGVGLITDEDYDRLRDKAELKFPNDNYFNSIGSASNLRNARRHVYKIQSLEKVKIDKMNSFININEFEDPMIVVSPKFDGVTLVGTFEYGKLTGLVTRGDGTFGQDVSKHIDYINFKSDNKEFIQIKKVIIRFEGIVSKSIFIEFLSNEYDNPRNCASGLISDDNSFDMIRHIDLIPLDILMIKKENDEIENHETLDDFTKVILLEGWFRNSLQINHIFELIPLSKLEQYFNLAIANRQNYPYDLDGIVVSNGGYKQDTARSKPIHKKAIKFPITVAEATISYFSYQVGKTGRITPLCHIKPITLMGTVITKMSLNNMSDLSEKYGELRVGDIIGITKGGDIIPRVESRITINPNGELCAIPDVVNDEEVWIDGVYHMVSKPLSKSILKWLISHNIDKIGNEIIKKILSNHPSITSVLTFLKAAGTISIYSATDSKMDKYINDKIESLKNTTLYNILLAMQFKNFGRRLTQKWINGIEFTTSVDELIKTNPFPQDGKTYEILNDELTTRHDELQELFDFCNVVKNETIIKLEKKENIKMIQICLTGKVMDNNRHITRDELVTILGDRGYQVLDKVTKDCAYLVVGEKPGSTKLRDAEKRDITIIDYHNFILMSE